MAIRDRFKRNIAPAKSLKRPKLGRQKPTVAEQKAAYDSLVQRFKKGFPR